MANADLEALEQLLKKALDALDLKLADLEKSNHGRMLRVFIEKEPADGRGVGAPVTLDDCEAASRHIQRVLEVEGTQYERLEVSSPGLDRRLRTAADFARFTGHKADIELRSLVNGRRHIIGLVERVEGETVELETQGEHFRFDLANVRRARLVPEL